MDGDAFENALRVWLREEFGSRVDNLPDNAPLFADGLLDSFSMLALVAWVEKTADIKFGILDVTVENLESIEAIVRFTRERAG